MKKLLRRKFLPANHRQEAFLDYHNLQQLSLSVEELIHEFDKLRMRCDVNEKEEQIIAQFLGTLKPEIADVVSLQPYLMYEDVCRLALKVEKQQSKGKSKVTFGHGNINPKPNPVVIDKGKGEQFIKVSTQGGNIRAPRCFKCQGLGHYARECPNQRIVTLWDDSSAPVYDTEEDYENTTTPQCE
ncbi:uncharacterized protein [Rutidosis leptorrhynchoides]|uniref:uncharacterized protein n=1 Tax=Rutidosis leptorrhynchoides TaxID=125765 RepID=UPI003A9A06E4